MPQKQEGLENSKMNESAKDIKAGSDGEDEDEEMLRVMSMAGFSSTQGKHVADNTKGAVRQEKGKPKVRQFRQFMNRSGGFNKILSGEK